MIGIYCFTNKQNGKRYIGKSIHIKRRIKEHKKYAKDGCDDIFHRAIRKYGIEGFDFEILKDLSFLSGSSKEEIRKELNYWETYYIAFYKTNIHKYGPDYGYNQTDGGDGGYLGEAVGKKIGEGLREYYKTNEVWNKGLTKDTNEGLKKNSEKNRLAHLGKKATVETKQKMSVKHKGVNKPEGFGDIVREDSIGKRAMHLGSFKTWVYRDNIEQALLDGFEFGWDETDKYEDKHTGSKKMKNDKTGDVKMVKKEDIPAHIEDGWRFYSKNEKVV